MKRTQRLTVAAILCGVVIGLSAQFAFAQSPSVDGYDEAGGAALGLPETTSPRPGRLGRTGLSSSPATGVESKALAFTGFGVPLLALLGGTLIAAGALTRRRSRSQAS